MRGDQLVLQPRGFRALEASPDGLTVAGVAMVDAAQGTARKESPSKAYSNNWNGLFCYKRLKPIVRLKLFLWPSLIGEGNKLQEFNCASFEDAGISKELWLYDATRHSIASQLFNAGVSLGKIREVLGHSDIRTTQRYAHGQVESLRADLQKLSLKKIIEINKQEKKREILPK